MFPDSLTEQQLREVAVAASVAVACYDTACADPKHVIPTPLHAAMFRLKQAMEPK